ncbi:MAG: hypothetical protein HWE25_15435 [Alphaproteobacteria bacterium]|nr:hypothetical protein [Alphaproteobacteria bacterium]
MKPMTVEEFELLRVRYGSDTSLWPEDKRVAAEAFLASEEGALFEASERALDELMRKDQRGDLQGDVEADAFLSRLLDIPATNSQQIADVHQPSSRNGFFALLEDVRSFFSPLALAAQGGAFAVVLALGVFVGSGTAEVETMTLDLSSMYFSSDADLYFGEGE